MRSNRVPNLCTALVNIRVPDSRSRVCNFHALIQSHNPAHIPRPHNHLFHGEIIMKIWMKAATSTALAAIGGIVLTASVYGQEQIPAVPTNCIIIADEVLVDNSPFTSAGTMDLSPGESSSPDEAIQWLALINDGFSAQSDDPVLGTITWDLDEDRPVTTSIVRSNQEASAFPATVQLDFNVRATISSKPGQVFLSRTPISIGSNEVQNWPPGDLNLNSVDADANGEADPVEFYEESAPEVTAFIVNVVRSRVRD